MRTDTHRLACLALPLLSLSLMAAHTRAECPLDHVGIGQQDGKLLVDTSNLYRHWNADYGTNPDPYGADYYELMSMFPAGYSRTEPGTGSSLDPNVALSGDQGTDYRIYLKREFATPGMEFYDGVTPILAADGDSMYLYDEYDEDPMHIHLRMFLESDPEEIYVVKYSVWDQLADGDSYEASDPWLVFFGAHPAEGDVNCDGEVNLTDLTVLGSHYGAEGQTWLEGDFTGDGLINLTDLTIMGGQYGETSGSSTTGVPEPASLSLVAIGAMTILMRRRRRLAGSKSEGRL